MYTSGELKKIRDVREPPQWNRFDEAVWQAWQAKGRARDRRKSAARMVAVKWASLAGLVVVAGLGWSHLGPYGVAARFLVAAGAIAVMFQAVHDGRYALAAMLAAVALLYNPVAPVFRFSGDWPRAVALASALPFVASLTARIVRKERDA